LTLSLPLSVSPNPFFAHTRILTKKLSFYLNNHSKRPPTTTFCNLPQHPQPTHKKSKAPAKRTEKKNAAK
jgi:hypothetical protein